MRPKWFFLGPLAVLGIVLFAFIGGEVVKLLWNWLLPPLFGWREVTFWQALGMLALCRILFGGFGRHSGGRSHWHRRGIADRVADRVNRRWEAMPPEERERFRQRMRERFGTEPAAGGGEKQDQR